MINIIMVDYAPDCGFMPAQIAILEKQIEEIATTAAENEVVNVIKIDYDPTPGKFLVVPRLIISGDNNKEITKIANLLNSKLGLAVQDFAGVIAAKKTD